MTANRGHRKVGLVIGDPISHSLSPILHNTAYEYLGLSEQMVFSAAHVTNSDLESALEGAKALGLFGMAVTIPHKEKIRAFIDHLDSTVDHIGALNTIVNQAGTLVGYNTDYLGILRALDGHLELAGAKVAILGAGGAGRAAAYALSTVQSQVCIFNRNLERAKTLARDFRFEARALTPNLSLRDFQVIINTTPVGMWPKIDASPLPSSALDGGQIVFDTIYNPLETQLLSTAKKAGCKCISGLEMFVEQGLEQVKLFTGSDLPSTGAQNCKQLKQLILQKLTDILSKEK